MGTFWTPILMAYPTGFLFLSFIACAKGRILEDSFKSQRQWVSYIHAPLMGLILTPGDRMSRKKIKRPKVLSSN